MADEPHNDDGSGLPVGTTHGDVLAQAGSLPRTLELLERGHPQAPAPVATEILFTGCGASYHAAAAAAQLLSAAGGVGHAAPASEIWLSPDTYLRPGRTVVALSRTGTTTEVVRALEQARQRGLATRGITLAGESPVAELPDESVVLSHVKERGRVMTQSFANLLLCAQWLALSAAPGGDEGDLQRQGLRDAVGAMSTTLPVLDRAAAEQVSHGTGHYVFLASAPLAPVCAQAVLMMQEMTQLPSESHAALEYRHGPIAGLTGSSLLVVLATRHSLPYDVLLARDALVLGHRPVVVGAGDLLGAFPGGATTVVLPDGLPTAAAGTAALPYLQLLALHQTLALGRDPESVRNLDRTQQIHVNPHVVDVDLAQSR